MAKKFPPLTADDSLAMLLALSEAEMFVGATAPNPPVGAVVLRDGNVIGVGAHMRAGSAHAEVVAMEKVRVIHGGAALKGATLVTTLEPCNHQGQTPPCSQALIQAGIAKVVIGAHDPNPNVKGGGIEALKAAGIEVVVGVEESRCKRLIAPFVKWARTASPWVVHKIAWRITKDGEFSMIPDGGARTFTSPQSLREAHLERRRADAILTGIGTVLADSPQFNVRNVPDHPNRKRVLSVISADGAEPPQDWLEQEWDLGFEVLVHQSVDEALKHLGQLGCHRVLVEAGPQLSKIIVDRNIWDERLLFLQNIPQPEHLRFSEPVDSMQREFREQL